MREKQVMANENLLCFHKVCWVEVMVNAPTIEPSPRHVLTSPADTHVVKGKVTIFRMNLGNETLHYWYPPAHRHFVPRKDFKQILIPEIFSFCRVLRIQHSLVICKSDVLLVTKIEILCHDLIPNPFQYPFCFALINGTIQKTMLKRDKFNIANSIDSVAHKGGDWSTFID